MTYTWLADNLNHLQLLQAFNAPSVISMKRQDIRNIEPDSTPIFHTEKPREFKMKTPGQAGQ